jgi:tetratricopeptide (TPR) repeat protein
MKATGGRLIHWALLAGLLIAATLIVLVWSTHSVSYPNPADARRSVDQLSRNGTRDREFAVTRLLLLCLDDLSKGDNGGAVAQCSSVTIIDPQNVTAYKLRGNAYLHSRRPQQAVEDFTRALTLSPADADTIRFRANAYAAQKRDALALADYDRAIILTPDNPINFQLRGYLYQIRGKYHLAIADFSTAIAMQPRLAAAWNSRCWTRGVAGVDLAGALADCDKSIALAPSNANAWDSRGLVLLKLGRYRDSIGSYTNALKREPKLVTSLFGRAVAKLRIGDRTAPKDLADAKAIQPGIEAEFLRYGIKLKANGPPGT